MMRLMDQFSEDFFELRKRLIRVVICFLITFGISFFFAGEIIKLILSTGVTQDIALNSFAPWDVIQVYLKCTFILTLLIDLPIIMLEVWLYISPALTRREKKIALMHIPFAIVLLAIGLVFSYFIAFQLAFLFTRAVARELQIQTVYGISEYFTFLFNIIVPVSFMFEMPVVGMFLTRIGILSPEIMKKMRKVAYMIILIIATAITPPDFISDFILILPLLGLYELSIGISKMTYMKMQRYEGV